MKNKNREDLHHPTALTLQALEELKSRGFQYVRVNGVTHDHRSDYMEPRYFALTPLKELPDDMDKKGIFEPIDSQILASWANLPDEGIKVFIVNDKPTDTQKV